MRGTHATFVCWQSWSGTAKRATDGGNEGKMQPYGNARQVSGEIYERTLQFPCH